MPHTEAPLTELGRPQSAGSTTLTPDTAKLARQPVNYHIERTLKRFSDLWVLTPEPPSEVANDHPSRARTSHPSPCVRLSQSKMRDQSMIVCNHASRGPI